MNVGHLLLLLPVQASWMSGLNGSHWAANPSPERSGHLRQASGGKPYRKSAVDLARALESLDEEGPDQAAARAANDARRGGNSSAGDPRRRSPRRTDVWASVSTNTDPSKRGDAAPRGQKKNKQQKPSDAAASAEPVPMPDNRTTATNLLLPQEPASPSAAILAEPADAFVEGFDDADDETIAGSEAGEAEAGEAESVSMPGNQSSVTAGLLPQESASPSAADVESAENCVNTGGDSGGDSGDSGGGGGGGGCFTPNNGRDGGSSNNGRGGSFDSDNERGGGSTSDNSRGGGFVDNGRGGSSDSDNGNGRGSAAAAVQHAALDTAVGSQTLEVAQAQNAAAVHEALHENNNVNGDGRPEDEGEEGTRELTKEEYLLARKKGRNAARNATTMANRVKGANAAKGGYTRAPRDLVELNGIAHDDILKLGDEFNTRLDLEVAVAECCEKNGSNYTTLGHVYLVNNVTV